MIRTAILAVLLAVAGGASLAQEQSATGDEVREERSVAALRRMGDYIASLKTLAFESANSMEIVLANDQKIEIGGTAQYRARVPDRLWVSTVTDAMSRVFYYDGKTLTVYTPQEGYYADFAAPPTIRDMLVKAVKEYGLEMPLADLFEWATPAPPFDDVREGFYVGQALINGVECDHWAFRNSDLDWEVWIRAGDKPLPCKIAIVNTTDPMQPRYSATLNWLDAGTLGDDIFTFVPPENAKRVDFMTPTPREPAQ